MSPPAATANPGFDIAVVIPLEFHRGQAIDCLRGWTREQDYPAERYQVVVGAPDNIEPALRSEILALLRPGDRLACFPCKHDVPLVDQAARLADSALLLFSESHCLPLPGALGRLLTVAEQHPEWAGFSCPTVPITHNLLSEIEADIYDEHIRGELAATGWLKVIDQCFVVRRASYLAAGGFRPAFGHFAEWLLAAEMHGRGLTVGFHPEPVIRHYYIGELDDLEAFTLDFAHGQAKYLAECGEEAAAAYFPPLPEIHDFRKRTASDHRLMARAKTAALPAILRNHRGRRQRGEPTISLRALAADWFAASFRSGQAQPALRQARRAARGARRRLRAALGDGDKAAARAAFVIWFDALVRQGRLQYLATRPSSRDAAPPSLNYPPSRKVDFGDLGDTGEALQWQGFFDREIGTAGQAFRWSRHVACIWLPLYEGRYRLRLDWDIVRPLAAAEFVALTFNGEKLPASAIDIGRTHLLIDIDIPAKAWYPLRWSVLPFAARDDNRLLGLPLKTVGWFAQDRAARHEDGEAGAPVYFLHVPKCAGTSLRLILDNAFAADAMFSPHAGRYYTHDLADLGRESVRQYYRGHFRWSLPTLRPDLDWRTVTVLRHPVDRLLSRFHYMQQHASLHPATSFASWLDDGIRFTDTMTAHLLPESADDSCSGGEAVRQRALAGLDAALANLRRCRAVGLQETIEDSVNLLCWHLGILPPEILARNNPTLSRKYSTDLPAALLGKIEYLLAADFRLYEQARQQFDAGMAALTAALPTELADTRAVRQWLRRRALERLPRRLAPFSWSPDDRFDGDNLHAREMVEGQPLRWTGPSRSTRFVLRLEATHRLGLSIRLHPATPPEHALASELWLNGEALPLTRDLSGTSGIRLTATIPVKILASRQDGLACFTLNSPTIEGQGEFRQLGLALRGIDFFPA